MLVVLQHQFASVHVRRQELPASRAIRPSSTSWCAPPEGTSLAATTAIAEQIATSVRQLPGVKDTLLTVGNGADASVNSASIYVKLTDTELRTASQTDLMQQTRHLLASYPKEIHAGVELVSAIGGNQSNAEVQFFIQGPDLTKLAEYSGTVFEKMKSMPGVADPDTTLRSGKPEIRLDIDRARGGRFGRLRHRYRRTR